MHVAVQEQQFPVQVRLAHGVACKLVSAVVCAAVAGFTGACRQRHTQHSTVQHSEQGICGGPLAFAGEPCVTYSELSDKALDLEQMHFLSVTGVC